MPIDDYLESHSHRQHLGWLAWLRKEWNEPDRHDYYIMRLTLEVLNLLRERKDKIQDLDKLKLPFKTKKEMEEEKKPTVVSAADDKERRKRATAMAMAKWLAPFKGKVIFQKQ